MTQVSSFLRHWRDKRTQTQSYGYFIENREIRQETLLVAVNQATLLKYVEQKYIKKTNQQYFSALFIHVARKYTTTSLFRKSTKFSIMSWYGWPQSHHECWCVHVYIYHSHFRWGENSSFHSLSKMWNLLCRVPHTHYLMRNHVQSELYIDHPSQTAHIRKQFCQHLCKLQFSTDLKSVLYLACIFIWIVCTLD